MADKADVPAPDSLHAIRHDDDLLTALARGDIPDTTPLTVLMAAFRYDCVRQSETP